MKLWKQFTIAILLCGMLAGPLTAFGADKKENKPASVEMQCQWLRGIGFQDVDCFFKTFELALFGGRKI